jgi:hypothetical protein
MNMICYDCNPASQGSCTDPVRDNATEVYCPRLADMLSYCFSVYVDGNAPFQFLLKFTRFSSKHGYQ